MVRDLVTYLAGRQDEAETSEPASSQDVPRRDWDASGEDDAQEYLHEAPR